MATNLEYLSFKASLPWYKRILFPLFLNKKEYDEYIRITTEEKSDLDVARDIYLYHWNEYMKDPSYQNKKDMEWARSNVEMMLRLEGRYYEDTYRSNEDVNYLLRRNLLV
jgi:hypothetical protein